MCICFPVYHGVLVPARNFALFNTVEVSFGTIFLCKSQKYDILSTAGISLPLCGRGGGGARYPSNFPHLKETRKYFTEKSLMGQINLEEIFSLERL